MNSYPVIEIDEFGRDTSLKRTKFVFEPLLPTAMSEKFKTMSWAEICYEIEEEEEREAQREAEEELKKRQKEYIVMDKERKELLAKGDYELEEGEILE